MNNEFLEENVMEEHQGPELKYELAFPNSQRAVDEAAKLGLDVVYPKDNELQLDIDNDESFAQFEKLRDVVNHYWNILDVEIHPSKSGLPKRHVTITTNTTLNVLDRILIQACLGSDRTRELLNYLQVLNGDAHPVLFLELKSVATAASAPLQLTDGDILTDADIPF